MFTLIKRSPTAVVLAIILHFIIVIFLLFGLDWVKHEKPVPKAAVVQARAVDAQKMQAELNRIKQAEEKQQAAKAAALRAEEQRLAELKQQQVEEKQRLQTLEKQRQLKEQEQQRREAEAARQAQLKKEKAAQEARRKAAAEKKRKAEAEAKRKAEAEKKRKAEAEAKRKAEAEKKRKAEAAAQAAREQALQDQLAAEQNSREIDRYATVIKQQVERSWLRPQNVGQGLTCVVQVRLIPGGDVVPGGVSIIKSSGNAAFDRSVETAVYKAAPLPVPSGSLFESFRNFKLYFNPQ